MEKTKKNIVKHKAGWTKRKPSSIGAEETKIVSLCKEEKKRLNEKQ